MSGAIGAGAREASAERARSTRPETGYLMNFDDDEGGLGNSVREDG